MQKNILKSGISLSELSLGCISLGADLEKAEQVVDCAVENGVTYFDTAGVYDKGINESVVGRALLKHQQRDDIFIGTEVGSRLTKDGSATWGPSKPYVKEAVKSSLKRLGINHINLYQLHSGTIGDPLGETTSAFDGLKQEEIIRAYGISSIHPNVIDYYLKHSQIETVMSQFSLIDNRPESLLDAIHNNDARVLTRGPMSKGLLTSDSANVLDNKFKDGIFDYSHDESGETVASIREIESNLSVLTFSYLTSHDVLGSIIVGASSADQLKENIESYHTKVSLDQIKTAGARIKDLEYTNHLVWKSFSVIKTAA